MHNTLESCLCIILAILVSKSLTYILQKIFGWNYFTNPVIAPCQNNTFFCSSGEWLVSTSVAYLKYKSLSLKPVF